MLLIGPWYAQHASLACGAAQWHRSVAPLSAIAIYRISLSFAGNELGNAPTALKHLRWRRRLYLICTSGQRRTNTLVARTYARWPLRASGVLDPLARTGPQSKKSRRASGPAVNVEACIYVRNPKTVATPVRIYTYTYFAIEIWGFYRRLTDTLRYQHTRCSHASGLLVSISQHVYQVGRKVEFTRSLSAVFGEFWKITIVGPSSIHSLAYRIQRRIIWIFCRESEVSG